MVRLLEQHECLLRPASLWLGITVPFQGEPCRVGMQSSEVFCCRGSSHGGLLFVVFSAGFEWYIGVLWGMFSLSNFPQTLLAYPQNRLFIFGGTPVCIGAWRHQYCHSNQNSSAGFQPEGRVNHGPNVGVWKWLHFWAFCSWMKECLCLVCVVFLSPFPWGGILNVVIPYRSIFTSAIS